MYVRIHVVGGMSVETVDGWNIHEVAKRIASTEAKVFEVRNRKTNRLVLVQSAHVTMVEEFDE